MLTAFNVPTALSSESSGAAFGTVSGATFTYSTTTLGGFAGFTGGAATWQGVNGVSNAVQHATVSPKARWRASKGQAPVNRFTRSFGTNSTEGWHRSMPVGYATGGMLFFSSVGAALTLSAAPHRDAFVATEAQVAMVAQVLRQVLHAALQATLSGMTATVRQYVARGVTASVLQGAAVYRQPRRALEAMAASSAALARTNIVPLVPDGTVSNAGWTPVGAATLQAALASSDSDYMRSTTVGSVAEVSFSNPAVGLTLSDGRLTLRIRLG